MEKVKDEVIFRGIVKRRPIEIYKNGSNGYYAIMPFWDTENNRKIIKDITSNYKGKDRNKVKVFERQNAEKRMVYLKVPVKYLEAIYFTYANRNENEVRNKKMHINNNCKTAVKQPSVSTLKKALAICSVCLLVSVSALAISSINNDGAGTLYLDNQEATVQAADSADYGLGQIQIETEAQTQAPGTSEFIEDQSYLEDLMERVDSEFYKEQEGGADFYDMVNLVELANYCYNEVKQELIDYNNSVPEEQRYDFKIDYFDPTYLVGRQIRETSGKVRTAQMDQKRLEESGVDSFGPLEMKYVAGEEANEVSKKLTGDGILESHEDYYNLYKCYKANLYEDIKSDIYLRAIFGDKYYSLSEYEYKCAILDIYNMGYGTFKNYVKNGYTPRQYSTYSLGYGECFETENFKDLVQAKSGSNYSRSIRNFKANTLWQVEDFINSNETQPGN